MDKPCGLEGCGIALSGDEFYNFASRNKNQTTGLRPWENHTTALTRAEMHPYPRLRRYFPRRGKF